MDFSNLNRKLELEMNLKEGLIDRVMEEEDDWRFTIQIVSIFDHILSHLISKSLSNDEKLRSIVQLMPISGIKMGKIKFAKLLLDFTHNEIKLLKEISEIRNIFAHQPHHAFSSIDDVFEDFPKEKKKWLIQLLGEFHLNQEESISELGSSHISRFFRNCCEQIVSSMRLKLNMLTIKHHPQKLMKSI